MVILMMDAVVKFEHWAVYCEANNLAILLISELLIQKFPKTICSTRAWFWTGTNTATFTD